jgi:YihY family inner membrane protein
MARSNTPYNSKVKHFEMKRFYSHSKKLLLLLASEFALPAKNIGKTADQYSRINGEQCAASFAYYAFFSLFPLILLLVVVGTFFIPDRLLAARRVVEGVEQFVPLQPDGKAILVLTVDNTINNGWRAGIFGFLALLWSAIRFFQALVIDSNRAWGFKDYNWWKLPLKNLSMMGILISALLIGLGAPIVCSGLKHFHYFDVSVIAGWLPGFLPPAIMFYGLLMFDKFAPRRSPPFAHVWMSALIGALLLELGQICFGWYLATFSSFNAIYGVFGTIMGLLLWIYVSGAIMLFCGCLAATNHPPAPGTVHVDSFNSAKN